MMEQVLCYPRSLCLPVQPEPPGTVMDMIVAENGVDGRMHLDASDLSPHQVLLVIDVMDVIALDYREDPAQMSHDTSLSAVMDMAAPHCMASCRFFGPPLGLGQANTFALGLGSVFIFLMKPFVIITLLQIFPEGDAAALGFVDMTVFDDPAL